MPDPKVQCYAEPSGKDKSKSQSAMEYLMTYGWSILIIAVVIIALFALGVFNGGNTLPTSCVAQSGFLCKNPQMDINGNVLVTFGQALGSTISITDTGCSNSTSPPSTWIQQPVSGGYDFVSGATGTLGFQCKLSSNTIGTTFSGNLWIQYSKGSASGQEAEIGTFTATAGTAVAINLGSTGTSGSVGGTGLASTPSYTYNSGSGVGSNSVTVSSGDDIFCAAAVGYGDAVGQPTNLETSWSSNTDAGTSYSSVGHQTSLTCSADTLPSYPNYNVTVGGISVTTSLPYTITASAGLENINSYSEGFYNTSYTLSKPSFVVIMIACGVESSNDECNVATNSTGCVSKFYQSGSDGAEIVIGMICQQENPGTYYLNVTDNNLYYFSTAVSTAVYAFNLQTSPVCAQASTQFSEIYTIGLKQTILNTTESCGATNYQWYGEAPGASSFSEISGATSNTYTFSPSGDATLGTYQFEVQTSNNQGDQATSAPVNVVLSTNVAYVPNYLSNNVVSISTDTGNVLNSMTFGFDLPRAAAFSLSGSYAYVTNYGSNNVVIINTATNTVTGSITAGFNGPFSVAISPYGSYAYVTNSGSENVVIINTATNTVTGSITSGFYNPYSVAFSPSGSYAYVANFYSNNVVIINTATNTVTGSISSGFNEPAGVAFSPSGSYAYVTNYHSTNVVIINTNTDVVESSINLGTIYPYGIAISPDGSYAYLVDGNVVIMNTATHAVTGSINSGIASFGGVAFYP